MLKLVIINNNENITKEFKNILASLSIKKDFRYECYKFNDNDKKLDKYISSKYKNNIYIIVNDKNIDSVNIVKKIRCKYHDALSFIIIVNFNNNNEVKQLSKEFIYNTLVLDCFENNKNIIENVIAEVLESYSDEQDCFIFRKNKSIYKIPYEDILYIEKQPNSKISTIHCIKETIDVNMTLSEIKQKLNKNFVQTHRSFLVNKRNIAKIKLEEGKIIFHNGEESYAISRSYKKEIEELITNK